MKLLLKIITFELLLMSIIAEKPVVYFTREITPDSVVKMYKKLGVELKGKVALKIHSGEKDGKYFLTPAFLKSIKDYTSGTYVECNTAYEGMRHTTELHKQLLKDHHWDEEGTVIMDKNPEKDEVLDIPNGVIIKKNYVGEHIKDFDSLLVLSHVKGHKMGGYGAALKQLSIGFGSQRGKTYIHTAGNQTDWNQVWTHTASQQDFTTAMADAASSVVNYFKKKKSGRTCLY